MDLNPGKLLAAAIMGAAFALSAAAHDGEESHVFAVNVEEAKSDIISVIGRADKQIIERIDGLDSQINDFDRQAVAEVIKTEVVKVVREETQLANERNLYAYVGAMSGVGLAGVLLGNSPFFNALVSALRKRWRKSSKEKPNNGSQREDDEQEEKSPSRSTYYVNKNAKKGKHKVHRADCRRLPKVENRVSLGFHDGCHSAVAKAKIDYPSADGCGICSYDCHIPD